MIIIDFLLLMSVFPQPSYRFFQYDHCRCQEQDQIECDRCVVAGLGSGFLRHRNSVCCCNCECYLTAFRPRCSCYCHFSLQIRLTGRLILICKAICALVRCCGCVDCSLAIIFQGHCDIVLRCIIGDSLKSSGLLDDFVSLITTSMCYGR